MATDWRPSVLPLLAIGAALGYITWLMLGACHV